jgi:hypothetical protein
MTQLLARKPIAALQAEAEEREVQALTAHGAVPLKRTLTFYALYGTRHSRVTHASAPAARG